MVWWMRHDIGSKEKFVIYKYEKLLEKDKKLGYNSWQYNIIYCTN